MKLLKSFLELEVDESIVFKIVVFVVVLVYSLMGLVFTAMCTWVLEPFREWDGTQVNFYLGRSIPAMFGFLVAALFLPSVLCWIGQGMQKVGQWMQKITQRPQQEE